MVYNRMLLVEVEWKSIPFEEKEDEFYWLKSDLDLLHFEVEEILWYPPA